MGLISISLPKGINPSTLFAFTKKGSAMSFSLTTSAAALFSPSVSASLFARVSVLICFFVISGNFFSAIYTSHHSRDHIASVRHSTGVCSSYLSIRDTNSGRLKSSFLLDLNAVPTFSPAMILFSMVRSLLEQMTISAPE